MLVRQLPQESATARAELGPVVDWSPTDYLIALVVDLLAEGNWQRAGDKKVPHPKPIRRPGDESRSRMTPAQIKERLLEQRRRREVERGD